MATRERWAAVFTSVELDVLGRSSSKFGPFSSFYFVFLTKCNTAAKFASFQFFAIAIVFCRGFYRITPVKGKI